MVIIFANAAYNLTIVFLMFHKLVNILNNYCFHTENLLFDCKNIENSSGTALTLHTYIFVLWKASGDIEKQQRMANGPANRGSLFNVRHAVLHSLRHFLFICSNVLYSRFAIQCSSSREPLAISLIIHSAVRHSPCRFLFILHNFRYLSFAIQCSPRR